MAALRAADLDLRRAERILAGEQVLAEQSGGAGTLDGVNILRRLIEELKEQLATEAAAARSAA